MYKRAVQQKNYSAEETRRKKEKVLEVIKALDPDDVSITDGGASLINFIYAFLVRSNKIIP